MPETNAPNILVVDNDPEITRVLALRLRHAGYKCVTAASGGQALADWQEQPFDLVISDLNMPGGDGITLADAIEHSEAVPIIFITGFRGGYSERLAHVKNVAIVEKPFELASLMALVGRALEGKPIGAQAARSESNTTGADGSD